MPHKLGILLAGILSLGCAGALDDLPVDEGARCLPCPDGACSGESLEITALGAAGFLLQRGADAIAVDPFFSNPSLLRVAFGPVTSDPEGVRRWMPDRPDVRAVLVGHAHYDHLLDVANVVRLKTPQATIYASETAKNLVASIDPGLAVTPLDAKAWVPGEVPDWTPIGPRIRVLALKSAHAPHLLGITLIRGGYDSPLDEPPRTGFGWKVGMSFAFVIDFLDDDGSVAFRVLHQDSAARPGVGVPPPDLPPARVRVAIPCVASSTQVDDYPKTLVDAFAPDVLVLGHWEDFFRPYSQSKREVRSLRGTDVGGFLERLRRETQAPFSLPLPGTRVRVASDCR